jgi:hypothetical protein
LNVDISAVSDIDVSERQPGLITPEVTEAAPC